LPDADVVAVVGSRGGQLARTVQFLKALRASLTPAPWRGVRYLGGQSGTNGPDALTAGDRT
jgi:hypothetical protein